MSALAKLLVKLLRSPRQVSLLLLTALAYAGLYLWLTGDLAGGGQGGVDALFPAWQRLFETRGPFQFEPVGLITLGSLVWTFSPLNLLLALLLGLLVALNLVAGWRLSRAPRACGLKPSGSAGTGLLAAIPALLAGGACCAPLVLIWLGLPIAGAVASLAPLLIPLAVLLLLAGLWGMARWLDVAQGGQLDDAEHSR
jgi:hypothetical protein